MATLNIFVSFEFDKDKDLKNNFYEQAREHTPHRICNCSLHESYPDDEWKRRAREAIEVCDLVVILIGQDTQNAPGVIVETDIARSLNKPTFQIKPQGRPYGGLTRLGEPIPWRWSRINNELNRIASQKD